MKDPWVEESLRAEAESLAVEIGVFLRQAIRSLDERAALPRDSESALLELDQPLPDSGSGAIAALDRLMAASWSAHRNWDPGQSSGRRFPIGGRGRKTLMNSWL